MEWSEIQAIETSGVVIYALQNPMKTDAFPDTFQELYFPLLIPLLIINY